MIDEYFIRVLAVVVISYLLGSFPTAYVLGRLKKINIFEVGSGNMGSTNVVRSMGCAWGLLVMGIDVAKGVIAIAISYRIMPYNIAAASVISAIVVIVGHNWSLFVALITGTLRGGKGAATALGTAFMILPIQVIAVVCVTGALLIALTRYVSLAALTMVAISAVWMVILILQNAVAWEYMIYILVVSTMIVWRFRENIQRLLAGTERRLGERA